MTGMNVTIDSEKFEKYLKNAPHISENVLQNIIYKAALLVERYSKIDSPFDSGTLQKSIATEIHPMRAEIKPNVHYALYVHEGTRYMSPRPFMKTGSERMERELEQLVQHEIKMLE